MKISCVMPTTQAREKFWPLAIAMFLSQDHADCELLIVGDIDFSGKKYFSEVKYFDASTHDGGQRYLFHGTGKEIRVLPFDGTIGAKINHAAQNATGEIIMRVDDDDWYRQDRITIQEKLLIESGAQMSGLTSLLFYEEGQDHGWEIGSDSWLPYGTSQVFIREWLLQNPIIDKSRSEDFQIALTAREQGVLHAVHGYPGLIIARDHDSHTGDRGNTEYRAKVRGSQYIANCVRRELDEWAYITVIFSLHDLLGASR